MAMHGVDGGCGWLGCVCWRVLNANVSTTALSKWSCDTIGFYSQPDLMRQHDVISNTFFASRQPLPLEPALGHMDTAHRAGAATHTGALALREPAHQVAVVKGVVTFGDTNLATLGQQL